MLPDHHVGTFNSFLDYAPENTMSECSEDTSCHGKGNPATSTGGMRDLVMMVVSFVTNIVVKV